MGSVTSASPSADEGGERERVSVERGVDVVAAGEHEAVGAVEQLVVDSVFARERSDEGNAAGAYDRIGIIHTQANGTFSQVFRLGWRDEDERPSCVHGSPIVVVLSGQVRHAPRARRHPFQNTTQYILVNAP